MRRSASKAFPNLMLVLAPVVLLSPVILAGKALFWGTPALQFMPWREYAWETLRGGHLPLWNPWLGMGAPLFANYQSALAYPITWTQYAISWLGGIEWAAWWQGVLVVLHWIIAAVGMSRLAGGLGLGKLAQAVSGLAYGLGGYLVARAGFLSINAATAWLPWVLIYSAQVSSLRLRSGSSLIIPLLKLAAVSGLQLLSGHAQISWYSLLLALMWSAYWGWIDAPAGGADLPRRLGLPWLRIAGLLKAWLGLAAGYVLGAALAAVQLLPTAEYLLQSQRAGQIDFEYAMTYSFWPWRFLTLLAPDLFGSPVRGDYWGYANYWEDALYIGMLPFLLALSACLGWIMRRSAYRKEDANEAPEEKRQYPRLVAIPFLLFLLVITFVLALGSNTPIFPWLYRHVPTFDMFQAPTRFTIWAAFAMALLAGYGAHYWRRPEKRALYWTRLGTAGAVAVMIGAGLTWYLMGDISPTFVRAAALAGMWGIGAGVLSLLAPGKSSQVEKDVDSGTSGWWQWAVTGFVALDLIAAGWGLNPGIETDFYSTEADRAAEYQETLAGRRLYLSSLDEDALKYKRFLRFDTFDPGEDWTAMRAALLPNMNMFDGVPSVNNFDPLIPARYSRWVSILAYARGSELQKLLDLSAVGAVENLAPERETGVRILSLPDESGARARWVPCARSVQDSEQALLLVVGEEFDPDRELTLEGVGEIAQKPCEAPSSTGQVDLLDEQPGALIFRTNSVASGWLLLSDSWYPGWQASVDGAATPIYRANYLFRAVPVSGGEHLVRFVYCPLTFYTGGSVSALALLLMVVARLRFLQLQR